VSSKLDLCRLKQQKTPPMTKEPTPNLTDEQRRELCKMVADRLEYIAKRLRESNRIVDGYDLELADIDWFFHNGDEYELHVSMDTARREAMRTVESPRDPMGSWEESITSAGWGIAVYVEAAAEKSRTPDPEFFFDELIAYELKPCDTAKGSPER
jgi:hypothetical protein